jgi:hypothetical protein
LNEEVLEIEETNPALAEAIQAGGENHPGADAPPLARHEGSLEPPLRPSVTTPDLGGELKAYKLDWQEAEIRLARGRFTHTLSRPSPEMTIAREDELQPEIPIAKDGSFALPDSTAQEETDAKYYDRIVIKTGGYTAEAPTAHKAAAFQGLFRREIYLDPGCDIFGDEVTIIEEIGGAEEPDFTVLHVLRQPTEAELKKCRQGSSGGRLLPDKRGRQKLVTSSNLRSAMRFYNTWLVRIEGATAGGNAFSPDKRDEFVALVDPLIQRKVVTVLVDELTGGLLD